VHRGERTLVATRREDLLRVLHASLSPFAYSRQLNFFASEVDVVASANSSFLRRSALSTSKLHNDVSQDMIRKRKASRFDSDTSSETEVIPLCKRWKAESESEPGAIHDYVLIASAANEISLRTAKAHSSELVPPDIHTKSG
jgi:hypothetical protein